MRRRSLVLTLAALAVLAAWGVGGAAARSAGRTVFTATNGAGGNALLVYTNPASPPASIPTGGLGSGGSLENQGGVVLDASGDWLFVVNAGSNELSVFAVTPSGVALTHKVPSGGVRPISVTVFGPLVYVLNSGNGSTPGNITGFGNRTGTLTPIPGSTRPLSAGFFTGPAQIGFHPSGRVLVVTEKNTNSIDTYTIGNNGTPTGPKNQPSAEQTPFGFAFDPKGRLIVSDARGGRPVGSGLSSYAVGADGTLTTITAYSGTDQLAACWVVITPDGRYAYTTNTASGSISSFRINVDGSLTLLNALAAATGPGSTPIDMALSSSGNELYVLNAGAHSISAFRVNADGSLTPFGSTGGLPAGTNGLAAS